VPSNTSQVFSLKFRLNSQRTDSQFTSQCSSVSTSQVRPSSLSLAAIVRSRIGPDATIHAWFYYRALFTISKYLNAELNLKQSPMYYVYPLLARSYLT
jgi:hypothetical protein